MTTEASTYRRVGLLVGGLAVVALLAAACGSDEATTSTTNTQAVATTTPATVAPTTTAVPATTAAPATTTAPTTTAPTTSAPATTPPDTNTLAARSGCTPGTADSLPDGEWFGYVAAATADQLDFDLACWFSGDAAARAAAEDGEESPPPNDYYVRNANDVIRTLDVSDDAAVRWLPNAGDPSTEELVVYSDWLADRGDRGFQPGVWLTIHDGAVAEISEQYVP